ncbi:hypothetical protein [Marinobacterium rhizophilum]|uniref:Cthe-2314-like HEPN domain-containing protein n=1 Tax=Marinobacterium rhizophilum TaxID=420402 RepID=A0ABY5HJW6_9GAMM|nr:hypothetical protein [Marinobacterium rhizophilum]UTW12097.1 hypothetical protein KDW95_23260 [Marinobacterium rhizophilum]
MLAPMEELQKNYRNAVFDALAHYQFIESLLKDCITLSNKIIHEKTKDILGFTYSEKRLNDKALQALCSTYMHLTKNKSLVGRIKSAAEHRNNIAHEACFENWKDRINNIDAHKLHEKGCSIKKHADEASKMVGELLKEYKALQLELEQLTRP